MDEDDDWWDIFDDSKYDDTSEPDEHSYLDIEEELDIDWEEE